MVFRMLRKTLMRILKWSGGLTGFLLPILSVLMAGLVVVAVVGAVASWFSNLFASDEVVKRAWTEDLNNRAAKVVQQSVNPDRPDEWPWRLTLEPLAAIRMLDPTMETWRYEVELVGEMLKPQFTREKFKNTSETTTIKLICTDDQCVEQTITTSSEEEVELITQVVAWDGLHHLTYELKTTVHHDRDADGNETRTELNYWVVASQWREPYDGLLELALVNHYPPFGDYENPEQLEENIALVHFYVDSMAGQDLSGLVMGEGGGFAPQHRYEGPPLQVGDWIWPMDAPPIVTSHYGPRKSPIDGVYRFHNGTDMWSASNNVYAVADGVVTESYYDQTYGYRVVISHDHGVVTTYNHLRRRGLKKGTPVKAGQLIGYMGNTGWSTAAHLHFEVFINDGSADPMVHLFADLQYQCSDCYN